MTIVYAAPKYTPADGGGRSLKFTFRLETVRLYYLFFFFTMIGFAIAVTRFWVVATLLAGVKEGTPIEKLGCGPFNRNGESDNKFGLSYGQGFEFKTENHLADAFGFSNICTNWDYFPAREATALYFPLFEYSLVSYIILEWVTATLSNKRGELSNTYMKFAHTLYPICIVLCAWFRMIFVVSAIEHADGHTAGFLGLQFALIIVSVMNVWEILATGQSYPNWPKAKTARFAWIYLILNLLITGVKIYSTFQIVTTGTGPPFYRIPTPLPGFPDFVLGQIIDIFYMLFNAIMPIGIAWKRRQSEEPLTIEICIPKHCYDGEDAQSTETTSLVDN